MKRFLELLFLLAISTAVLAQCNPEDEVESWYQWAKEWENYAIDQFPIGEEDEMKIGDSLHVKMQTENVLLKKHPKKAYINKIVQKLAKGVNRKGIRYRIHIIDDDKNLNAFSIAGGHLYITSKMISWAKSEDELAFIIGHEIAHVDNRHGIRKIQKLIIGETFGGDYGLLAANAELLLSAPFGQIDEYDADRSGAVLATKAGYNPRKGLRFFEELSKNESYDYYEKLIRTHPYSQERHNCLHDFMTNELGK